jgi:hypothetical protein
MNARMRALVEEKMAWARAYTGFRSSTFPSGLALLIVNGKKVPYLSGGVYSATRDLTVIAGWLERWPRAEFALAVPHTALITDVDHKHGRNGYLDFARLDGRDLRSIDTPQASSPSGGTHALWSASQAYLNKVRIQDTGIDLRWKGGYVVLPGPDNGRQWVKRLTTTPLAPAPVWIADLLKNDRPTTSFRPIESRTEALWVLKRAVEGIITAAEGQQEDVRHRQCFRIGVLIAQGALDYATACNALITAANEMPVYGDPWRDLEEKVRTSIARGMDRGQHAD